MNPTANKPLIAAAAAALLALGALAATPAAQAQTASIAVRIGAPPPPRHEPVPLARPGWLWTPGHWEVRGHHRYAWVGGA
ncbi:hypothetical protein [Curvibacter soli]|uniref:hypothetical protein n=1 Tax=Curvibacter soli TaxID=3031331 RepID=UPI003AEFB3C1